MQVINTGSEVSTIYKLKTAPGPLSPNRSPRIDKRRERHNATQSLSDSFALHISKLANKALCAADAPYDAVVITHGVST